MKKKLQDKHDWSITGGEERCFHEWPPESMPREKDLMKWKCSKCGAIQTCQITRNVECEFSSKYDIILVEDVLKQEIMDNKKDDYYFD